MILYHNKKGLHFIEDCTVVKIVRSCHNKYGYTYVFGFDKLGCDKVKRWTYTIYFVWFKLVVILNRPSRRRTILHQAEDVAKALKSLPKHEFGSENEN